MTRSLEKRGLKSEGAVIRLNQGISSVGLQRKFRSGGHGEDSIDLDFGKFCEQLDSGDDTASIDRNELNLRLRCVRDTESLSANRCTSRRFAVDVFW